MVRVILRSQRRIQGSNQGFLKLSIEKSPPPPSTTTINLALFNTVEIHFSCIWLSSKSWLEGLFFLILNGVSRESWEELSQSPGNRGGRRNFIVTVSLLPGRQITSSPTLSIRNFYLVVSSLPPLYLSRFSPSSPLLKVDKGVFGPCADQPLTFTADAR